MKTYLHPLKHGMRLRSFTLTEILVATLLSAILLAFVVTVFAFFMNRVRSENNNMDQMEDIFLLESSLAEMIRKCNSIRVQNDQLLLFTPGVTDAYAEFTDSLIVVCFGETCDTFRLSYTDLRYAYLPETELIHRIDFNVYIRTFSVPVSLLKEYEGFVLVNSIASAR